MSAHTPGPWIVYDVRDNPHDPIWVGTPAPGVGLRSLVAEVSTTEGMRTGPGDREANLWANARLIAAAPRMAEILLSAYQHVSHGGPKRGEVEDVLREAGLIR